MHLNSIVLVWDTRLYHPMITDVYEPICPKSWHSMSDKCMFVSSVAACVMARCAKLTSSRSELAIQYNKPYIICCT